MPPVLQSGIQSAIQGKWVFTRRIEGCAKPQAPGVSQAAHVFAQNSAHAVATGKATQRRNAELALVLEGTRWRSDVQRYAPERAGEFDGALAAAVNDPKGADHEGR